ncbi:MAG: Zn-ribbon domain-containing OB-fold protein [Anaerolineae bacterium]|nr:Zn-ribbon domain-containing OB-fold protein [Anaerolineae bacterium]MCB9129602.1 Zn-ribbon domain-containing OB-fold protein [Anaerolineales bacterium]MCB0227988.1 Zn-ribbon domain-containing OB-fold protein [Anaerolineae bacterium]MCB0234939.1 Zn-ribbon domain-containing OB-fold protein [Anaerolineae bacterium]MCB0239513.1 Zn-ribbon domain-containing OB-fold protein [Anaerolineae bacterium]
MSVARSWRTRRQRYSLVGERCEYCQNAIFPPRDVCPHCAEPAQKEYTMSGRGTVYSYTTVYDPPAGFEAYAPYPVALVKLDEGPMVTAQLTDVGADDVRIGMPVEMVTRKLSEQGDEGIIQYSYKFRPRWEQQAVAA